MANRTVSVSLKAEIADFMGKMGTAARGAKQFGDELGGLGKKNPQQLNDVAMAVGGVGVALLGVAGYAVKTAMEFDKQMSAVSAATRASSADMGRLREAALQAGKDTVFSATEAARGQTELAKAGVSTADILGGGLKGALDLAASGQMEVADSAELAASAMTQFGLSGKDVPHIADLLSAGAGKAQGSVKDMGMALNQSGLVANQFGLTIEDTTGTLAMFAKAGLVGSDAGTSFKQMLLMLARPSKEAAKTMDDLGIAAYDSGGKFVGITSLAEQLKTKMAGLTEEQRNAALATIFGADAIRAAAILYKNGAKGVDEWRNKVNDAGYAAEDADRKTDNLAGDLERLKGTFETVAIEAGSGANGGLRVLVKTLDTVVSSFSDLPGPVQTTLTVLAGLGGAGLVATAGLLKMKQTIGDALTALSEMGPMGERASGWIGKIGAAAAKLSVIGLVGFGLIEGLTALMDATDKGAKLIPRNVDKLSAGLITFANTGVSTGEAAKVMGANIEAFADRYYTAMTRVGSKSTKGWAQVDKDFNAMDKSFAAMVGSGNATQAKILVDQLSDAMLAQGFSAEQVKARLGAYYAATAGAAGASGGLAQGFGTAEANARTLAGSLEEAKAAGQGVLDVFKQLNGANLNLAQAQLNVENATRALDAALKDSGGSMDITTEKGGAAQQSAINLAKANAEVLDGMEKQGATAPQVAAAYDSLRAKFIDHIATAGGTRRATDATRQAAEALANQWFQMPTSKAMSVTLKDDATWRIIGIRGELNSLRDRSITVTTRQNVVTGETQVTRHSAKFERWGGVTEYAASGLLRDPAIYTPNGPARYGFAEPATQGEAFIPRNGDRLRALGILTKAASWHGANITTGGIPAGGVRATTQTTRIVIDGTGVLEGLRREVYVRGGNVQQVVGRSGR